MQTKPNHQTASTKPTVLVLEDDADQWFMIRWAFLQRFPELEPVWIADPNQAIQYLESCMQTDETIPKLILLDFYLPHYEIGSKTLNWLKSHALYREIPVIVLSQSNNPVDIRSAYQQGCNCYVVKPTSYEQWATYLSQFRQYWWKTAQLPDLSSH